MTASCSAQFCSTDGLVSALDTWACQPLWLTSGSSACLLNNADGAFHVCRNMDEMWDESLTEDCRQKFVKSMYKFPKNPTVKLSSGKRMPLLGLGTWKAAAVQDTVERALRHGFRCF